MAPVEPTLANLMHYSRIMANRKSTPEAIENAKDAIRGITSTMSADEHRAVTIDLLGSLRERDIQQFTAVMLAIAIHEGAI